jgi:hypothetical protein
MRRRRQLGTSSRRPRENQTWANNQPIRRDFDELNLVGDGMHLVDSPILRGRARYDSELSSHPVIRKLRRGARAGILNYVSDREELLGMPEVQELLNQLREDGLHHQSDTAAGHPFQIPPPTPVPPIVSTERYD